MHEGWSNDNYLILFSDEESEDRTERYQLADYLPGYRVVGLKGWDDFLVMDRSGKVFSVPTVPLLQQYMEPSCLPDHGSLVADERVKGRIKWYVTPVVFGGDPSAQANLTWVSHDQHVKAVLWWNRLYKDVARSQGHWRNFDA